MYLTTIIDLVRAEFAQYELASGARLEVVSVEPMTLRIDHAELGYAAHLVRGERVKLHNGSWTGRFTRLYVVLERPAGEPLVLDMTVSSSYALDVAIRNDIDAAALARVQAAEAALAEARAQLR